MCNCEILMQILQQEKSVGKKSVQKLANHLNISIRVDEKIM